MILVTGGTGFLGAHLLYQLVKDGHKIRALKRPKSSLQLAEKIFSYYDRSPDKIMDKIEWFEGDILDYESCTEALEEVKYVYHAAAVVSFHSDDKSRIIKTNSQGTANIVNAAIERSVNKFCHVSSIGALGRDAVTGLVNEQTPYKPSSKSSVYSKSKYEAEREVWRGIAEGLNAVIVNPSIIVGPGDWQKGSSQMFQTMWDGLKFYTSGTNGFIDVNDVVKAMILLMESDINRERFVLSSENVSYEEFFNWMADDMGISRPKYKVGPVLSSIGAIILKMITSLTGRKHTITRETARTANMQYNYSNEKFIKQTGFQFTPVRKSVESTVDFFLVDNSQH